MEAVPVPQARNPRQRHRAGLALLALLLPHSALAIVGGSGVDANTTDSPWAGVGSISTGNGTFSGALIGSRYVLTAAHVVGGKSPEQVTFNLNFGGELTHRLSVEAIYVFPGFTGTAPGPDGIWHDDLAVIKLKQDAPAGVPLYGLFGQAADLAGSQRLLTLVGYGGAGNGSNGAPTPSNPGIKRVGRNRVDQLVPDDDGGAKSEALIFDFDGPDGTSNVYGAPIPANLTLGSQVEAQFAGGDSGSPLFVQDHGLWKIAGIAAFNGKTELSGGSTVNFGSIGGATLAAPYADWIQAQMATPVPEPRAYTLLLTGLGLVGLAARWNKGARGDEGD